MATLVERFWAKVDIGHPDECWEWNAARRPDGYGWFSYGPRHLGQVSGHRMSWELSHGPIPTGLKVRHKCDNPPCVNPAHLELGTHADNMRDMAERGRQRKGGDSPMTTLSDCCVWAIRSAPQRPGVLPMLAERYGLSQRSIEHHRHGKPVSFKHIPSASEIRKGGLPSRGRLPSCECKEVA